METSPRPARSSHTGEELDLRLQFLVYPPLDFRADTPSMRETVDPVFFDRNDLAWCWAHYLAQDSDRESPLASPLRAPDVRGLPPARHYRGTRSATPKASCSRLGFAAAGVSTELVRFEGMVHGFYSMNGVLGAADEAQAVTAAGLRRAFALRWRSAGQQGHTKMMTCPLLYSPRGCSPKTCTSSAGSPILGLRPTVALWPLSYGGSIARPTTTGARSGLGPSTARRPLAASRPARSWTCLRAGRRTETGSRSPRAGSARRSSCT